MDRYLGNLSADHQCPWCPGDTPNLGGRGGTLELSADLAFPLGLIVTELAGNALRHAFDRPGTGTVWVQFGRQSTEHAETVGRRRWQGNSPGSRVRPYGRTRDAYCGADGAAASRHSLRRHTSTAPASRSRYRSAAFARVPAGKAESRQACGPGTKDRFRSVRRIALHGFSAYGGRAGTHRSFFPAVEKVERHEDALHLGAVQRVVSHLPVAPETDQSGRDAAGPDAATRPIGSNRPASPAR